MSVRDPSGATVAVRGLRKSYADVRAVRGICDLNGYGLNLAAIWRRLTRRTR